MRIGVIGATGKAGQVILTELKERGFETLAIVRSPEKLANDVSFIQRDILAITKEDLAPLDVVISAFGAKLGEQAKHLQIVRHFQALLKDTNKRLIIVGSGGFLYLDNQREKKVYDKIRLVKKRSKISEQSYDLLKSSQGFEWTYMHHRFISSLMDQELVAIKLERMWSSIVKKENQKLVIRIMLQL